MAFVTYAEVGSASELDRAAVFGGFVAPLEALAELGVTRLVAVAEQEVGNAALDVPHTVLAVERVTDKPASEVGVVQKFVPFHLLA